jgi:23S rRNA pseudouridine2605 synthase
MSEKPTERIAKRIAASGVCSRRDAEKLIASGRVHVNGERITSPALNVSDSDSIKVDGKLISKPTRARLWLHHKPTGVLTTHKDQEGRPTVFEKLPSHLPRVVSVGRLDMNSEGLLLLTTSGELARALEHPSTGLKRRYRVRVFGKPTNRELESLAKGITIDGIHYGSIIAKMEREMESNSWIDVTLSEGKNREIRRVFAHLGYTVNRLIRTHYGDFELGDLAVGSVKEMPDNMFKQYTK